MSKKLSKRELKADEFRDWLIHAIQWIKNQKEQNTNRFWVGIACLIVLPLALGFMGYALQKKSVSNQTEYSAALQNLAQNNTQLALNYLDRLDQENRFTKPAEVAYFRATVLYREGKTAEALALYEKFLKSHRWNALAPDAAFARAQCLENLNKLDEAEAAYREILKKYDDSYVAGAAKISLAVLLEKQNRKDEAIEIYRQILSDLGKLDETDRGFWYDQAAYKLESYGLDVEALLKEAASSSEKKKES